MKFTDLNFKKSPSEGWGATHKFDNGITISVQASKNHYCHPKENLNSKDDYSSFEIALFNSDGEFVTKDYIRDADDDVFGWAKRYDIDELMELILTKIQEGNQLEKGLAYAVDKKFITMSQAFEIIRNIK